MDITSSTIAMEDVCRSNYVSCIEVDGKPILPPIMTDERRQEMRRYKELAIFKERQLQEKKANVAISIAHHNASSNRNVVHTDEANDDMTAESIASARRSLSTSPIRGIPVTSTPRVNRIQTSSLNNIAVVQKSSNDEALINNETVTAASNSLSNNTFNTSDVPEGVLRELKIVQHLDFNNSLSSAHSGSSAALSYDGDEEKVDGSGSSVNDSGDNFASAASSTGTFVIRRSGARKLSQGEESIDKQVATSDDDVENEENAPPTVLRKPSLDEPVFKRKRPAKYFDEEEDGKLKSTPTSSISIATLPNSVPETQKDVKSVVSGTLNFSPVANTNFSAMANSLTNEFTQKFAALLASSSSNKSVAPNYDVTLSKDIPSSAEEERDFDAVSNSSDKENINSVSKDDSIKKHVRKLSYTLATPSAALLEAVSKDKNFVQTLETVPSVPSSTVPSAYHTPEKPKDVSSTGVTRYEELIDAPKLDRVSMKLQELNLGHGKQAHLQRFLGNQDHAQEVHMNENNTDQVEVILKQMQMEHEKKLQQLTEQHRLQELRIKKEFESELDKLKEKLSSTLNTTASSKSYKTSPNSFVESMNSSARSLPRPQTVTSLSEETVNNSKNITSGMSGLSGFEQTRSGGTSIYQFTGNSGMSTTSSTHVGFIGTTDLAGVGLSKLQSRMQLMSPSLFRVPTDAKSPLLKGLVFPDPLDKPRPPIRIPPKAFEASMKPKFDRLSAAVKGYLTRRLLHTEKVQIIVQTIRDTVDLLLRLYEEVPMIGNKHTVKPQDANLHQMLIQQLTGACQSFHDVFFKLSTKERMAIIATDREKSRVKALRNLSSPARRNISNATLKSLERRMSHRRTSPKVDNRKARGLGKPNDALGTQSVKPNPMKNFNISPKRRRISYWDERNIVRRSTSTTSLVSKSDLNGNNFKTPMDSARSQTSSSARSTRSYYPPTTGTGSETFIVPSSTPTGRSVLTTSSNNGSKSQYASISARRDSSTRSVGGSRSIQSTVTTVSTNRLRTSTSRQPWKSERH